MLNGLPGTLLEIVACLPITTTIPFILLGLTGFFVWLLFSSYWYIALLYLGWWLFFDRQTPHKKGRHLNFFRKLFLWKYLARYFPIKLHKTADLDSSRNYIFAFHPHGSVTFGAIVNFLTNATGFNLLYPGIVAHLLTVEGQFKFPFYRDYLLATGLAAVSAESIDYKLTQIGPGHSVVIVIGGAAEFMLVCPDKYLIKLKGRKGFIRRALKTGACIVPVFSFSEQRAYDVTYAKEGSAMSYFLKAIKFLFKVDMPQNFQGRPWFWTFVPKKISINTVIGAPIDFCEMKSFTKGQDPPEELVDECQEYYLEQLRKLYDNNKAQFGDENTPLIFV